MIKEYINPRFKNLLEKEEYQFLETDIHLGNNIALLVLGGSRAYGTNNKNSDIDIRGITLDLPQDLIGRGTDSQSPRSGKIFEQIVETNTDTTIYSLSKFFELAINGNPNILEILGVREEDIIYITPEGRKIMDNQKMFYSKKIIQTVGGFAESQLRRFENANARNRVSQPRKESHILDSIKRFLIASKTMFTPFDENAKLDVYQDISKKEGYEEELFIDVNISHYPLRDFRGIIKEMTNIITSYDKKQKGARNNKKDDEHMDKHLMHLFRLLEKGIEVNKTGLFKTYCGDLISDLLSIRNGKYRNDDGTYKDELISILDDLHKKMDKAIEETVLPDTPDFELIEKIKMDILFNHLEKTYKKTEN